MVTYYDSTTQKLPFITNNFNLSNPDTWQFITTGYNDSSNLAAPNPKVALDMVQHKGISAWIAERSGGNGVAMFDSPSSTWTGITQNNSDSGSRLIRSYPNPCIKSINLEFELKKAGNVKIEIVNVFGQHLGFIVNKHYSPGRHIEQYDVSDLPEGTYIYNFRSGEITTTGKFVVIR